ncbi:MAG: glycosyltransferase family 39 protein [Candidatus Omnitrophota bacterium]
MRDRLRPFLATAAALAALIYLIWTARYSLHTDEIEHLHCAYLVSEGALPYAGFWEHHSPVLWVLLSPVLKIFPPSASIVLYSRLFCFALSGLLFGVVWGIAKLLWKERADLSMALLCFASAGILSQFSILRPDPFMLFFSFASVYWALKGFQTRRTFDFFLSGFSYALGVSFSIKVLPWIIVMPLATCFMKRERGWNPLAKNLPYFLGILAGLAPLASYLTTLGLADEFFTWVMQFHMKIKYFKPEVLLAGPLLFLGGMTALLFLKKRLKSEGAFFFACLALVVLCAAAFLNPSLKSPRYFYYLAPLAVVAGILAGGLRGKGFLTAAVILALLIPNGKLVIDQERRFAPLGEQLKLVDWLARHFREEYVVIFYPWHPVYAKDPAFLYMPVQIDFLKENRRAFRQYAAGQRAWADDMIAREPSVIAKWDLDRMIPVLRKYGLLTERDYARFLVFLRDRYARATKFGAPLYIRKGHEALTSVDGPSFDLKGLRPLGSL